MRMGGRERERERERERCWVGERSRHCLMVLHTLRERGTWCVCVSESEKVYIYMHIFTHTYIYM